MVLADSFISLATASLAVLFALDVVTIWHIYAVMFIRSLAGSFHSNAMNASTSLFVPVENLTRVQGINQMLNGGLNIVSAPLGALLLELMSMQAILMIDVATALLAILPLKYHSDPTTKQQSRRTRPGKPEINCVAGYESWFKICSLMARFNDHWFDDNYCQFHHYPCFLFTAING